MIIFSGAIHLVLGLGVYYGLIRVGLVDFNLTIGVIVSLYSLLPDIDHPGSLLGRHLWGINIFIYAIAGHRGVFHSILFAVVMSIPIWAIFNSNIPFYVAVASYIGHLIGDMSTKMGVAILYPWDRRFSYYGGRFRSWEEDIF